MPGEIYSMFADIFKTMGITRRELDDAEDELVLPKMTEMEKTGIADTGIDMIYDRKSVAISARNGIFSYKKRPVVVYIKEQYLDDKNIAAKKFNKYHLCYCKALQTAEKQRRFYNRYVMVRRTKGDFWTRIHTKGSDYVVGDYMYMKLDICQDCLRMLNWKNFNAYCGSNPDNWWEYGDEKKRRAIVAAFSIDEFLHAMREELRAELRNELTSAYRGR